MNPYRQIYGIDFSGAKDAGKRIWITAAVIEGGTLQINDCKRVKDVEGSGDDRETCYAVLRSYIKVKKNAIFGIDFPFGLPAELVTQRSWTEFATAYADLYKSPEEFRASCFAAAGNRELKRKTDRQSQSPLSPYNIRIYKQTYFGISKLIAPLVSENRVCVLPMQHPVAAKPWVLEICPAATLKKIKSYMPYKGRSEKHRKARQRILKKVLKPGSIELNCPKILTTVAEDKSGDALDSLIAAMATFLASRTGLIPREITCDTYAIEGWVYT